MSEGAEERQGQEHQAEQKPHLTLVSDVDANSAEGQDPIDFLKKKAEREAKDKEELKQKQEELADEAKKKHEDAQARGDVRAEEFARKVSDLATESVEDAARARLSPAVPMPNFETPNIPNAMTPVTASERSYSEVVSWGAIEDSLKSYESDLQRRRELPEGEKGRISQATYERDLRRKRGDMYQRMIEQRVEGVMKRFGVDDLNALKVGNFPDLLQHAGKNEVFRNVLIKSIQDRVDKVHEDPLKAAEFKLHQVKKIYGAATSETPTDGQVTKSWGERRVRGLRRQMAVDILSDEQNLPAVKEYIQNAEAYVKSEKERGNKNITEWPGGNLELAFHLRRIMAEQKRKGEKALRGDDVIDESTRAKLDEEKGDLGVLDQQEDQDLLQKEKEDLGIVDKKRETQITGMMDALGRVGSAGIGEDISGDDLKHEAQLSTDASNTDISADKKDEEDDDDDGVPVPIPFPIGGDRTMSRRSLLGKAGKVAIGVGVGLGVDAVLSPRSAGAPEADQIPGNPDTSDTVPHKRGMPGGGDIEPEPTALPTRPENPINDTPPGGEGQTTEPILNNEMKEEVEKWNIGTIKIDESGSSISQEMYEKGYIDTLNKFKDDLYLDDPKRMAAFLLIDYKDYLKSWEKAGNSDSFSPEDILEWAEKGGGDKLKQIFDTVQLGQHYYVPLLGETADRIYEYFKKIKSSDLDKTVHDIQGLLKARVAEIRDEKKHQTENSVDTIIKTFAPTQEQSKKKGWARISGWFGGKK